MSGPGNTYHYIGPETARLQQVSPRTNPSWNASSTKLSRADAGSLQEAEWIFPTGGTRLMNWTKRSSNCSRSARLQRSRLVSSRQRKALRSTSRSARAQCLSMCGASTRDRYPMRRCRTCTSGLWMSCGHCSVRRNDLQLRAERTSAALPGSTNFKQDYRGIL